MAVGPDWTKRRSQLGSITQPSLPPDSMECDQLPHTPAARRPRQDGLHPLEP